MHLITPVCLRAPTNPLRVCFDCPKLRSRLFRPFPSYEGPPARRAACTATAAPVHRVMELQVGQAVELMGVENAGIDITGERGVVTAVPEHGLASVTLDGGAVLSVWPENLKILRSSDTTPTKHTSGDSNSSGPAAKGE